ncbi:hypothetical protein EV127DRAFT_480502 [Xylaria flabelliformis]|nr:hypothetical protein EV127DRAFT_480502 [Xylaria flabelliformis]
MASFPPTRAQDPTSTSHEEADIHNASILAVRGLHTTATGNELFDLADLALRNFEIPTTPYYTRGNRTDPMGSSDIGLSKAAAVTGEALSAITIFEPFYFFFYGSLQILDVLQSVCEIEDENSIFLRKDASIVGWEYKMWGPFPALVPAAEGHVEGTLWLCEKPEHVAKLSTYETSAYCMAYCDVFVPSADESYTEVIRNARTFVNNQTPDELTDGYFDVAGYYEDLVQLW